MTTPLRCGILGCGVIAPLHIESFRRRPAVEVMWLCDVVESKARDLAEKYAIPHVTGEYQTVLDNPEVDCVSICTPHHTHVPISVAALRAGKHVLCEKPLATRAADLDALVDAVHAHPDLVFSGVFQHRFDRVYQYARRLVQEGTFGTLLTAHLNMQCLRTAEYYQADAWRGTWAEEGGSLMINQSIHFVDVLNWIMGGVEALCASYENRTHQNVIETEDTLAATLRFKNGALGSITATSSSFLSWEPTFTFHGTKGTLEICNGKVTRADFSDGATAQHILQELTDADEARPVGVGKVYYGPSHISQISDFVDAIREQRPPFIPVEAARVAVDLVLGMYRSAREKTWVGGF
ncbi:MAG: Gfo/Idh/MocA family oxidoreductase [Anaerolineae bacterium]|nr:Gfo/Idh/MocA family oxidoreductase [Anaerolineae bacterium]